VAHQVTVDDLVLVQRDERAEALPSDLLHALHLLDGEQPCIIEASGRV